MTIDRIATLLASIGTFTSTIIILFNLVEMGRQRRSTYRPDLVLGKSTFYCNNRGRKKHNYVWSNDKISDPKELKDFNPLYLNMFNIGKGAAKNVDIKWDFNIKAIIDQINYLNKKEEFTISLMDGSRSTLDIKFSEGSKHTYALDIDAHQSEDYILPANVESNPLKVRYPQSFLTLVSLYNHLFFQQDKEFDEPIKFTNTVTVKFTDIGDNLHLKRFSVILAPTITEVHREINSVSTFGFIEVKGMAETEI